MQLKSLGKNYLYNISYSLYNLLLPMITIPYLSRTLKVENIGVFNFIYSIAFYFVIVGQLGMNLYGKREIASCRDNKDLLGVRFSQLLLLRSLLSILVIVVYFILCFNIEKNQGYYYCFAFFVIANLFDISWLHQGMEEFKLLALRNFFVKNISILLIFFCVKTEEDLWKYILIVGITEAFSNITLWINIFDVVPFKKMVFSILGKDLKASCYFFAPQLIISIYTITDKLMLGIMSTKVEVGFYAQSEKVINIIVSIIVSVGAIVMPRIANIHITGDADEIKKILQKTKRISWLMGLPMACGLIGIANDLVACFFGDGYESVTLLLYILSPAIIFMGLSDVYGMQCLIPMNHLKEYTISVAIGASVNVILNIFLIERFGSIGAAVSTLLSEVSVVIVMYVFTTKYIRFVQPFPWEYAFSSGVMWLALQYMNDIFRVSLFYLLLKIFLGSLVYIAILIVLKDDLMFQILKNIRKIRA